MEYIFIGAIILTILDFIISIRTNRFKITEIPKPLDNMEPCDFAHESDKLLNEFNDFIDKSNKFVNISNKQTAL